MAKNIFNIKSNYNFLESLSFWLLAKYSDPFYLSKITILLPSRRACREIKKILLRQSKNQVLILPKIIAIGDVDYDELGPNFISGKNLPDLENLPQNSLSPLKYQLLLIDEIRKWNHKTHLFGKNPDSAQLADIAFDLQNFLQEVEKEQLNLDDLKEVDDLDLSGHRQQILGFLRHFGSSWQNILLKNNAVSKAKYINQMLEFCDAYLENYPSEYPIIIAGSTGSVKATAKLIKTISSQKNGFVILYGLDKNLSAENWQIIKEDHPQFLLKKLIDFLKIERTQISDLEFAQFKNTDDEILSLTSNALLPAEKTAFWPQIEHIGQNSIAHLSLIETRNNFDEAQIIALIIRQNLEKPNHNIALITNNHKLVLMVKMNLQKWQIIADDSKYYDLVHSEIALYIKSLAELFINGFKAVDFLGILKNPISKAGFEEKFYSRNLKLLELKILRGVKGEGGFSYLKQKIAELGDEELILWFNQIERIFEKLCASFKNSRADFAEVFLNNIRCAEELSRDFKGKTILYNLKAAEEFIQCSQNLALEITNCQIETLSYIRFLNHFLSGYNFSVYEDFHPRLHILSTIEARLLNYDLTIIAGLNEGEFPAKNTSDHWMSRKMRLDFGLFDPIRKIGVAAYDFSNYLAGKKVVLTRSLNQNNSPTVKSRFLMKLEAVLLVLNLKENLDDGSYYQNLLKKIFSDQKFIHIKRPEPRPNLKDRPQIISVTDIKKLISDPYFIYAKRILNLRALDEIAKEPSFAEFGNFVHKVLEEFVKNHQNILEEKDPKKLLNQYAQKIFPEYFPDFQNQNLYKILWWPKFENIAAWFIKNEKEIRGSLAKTFTELQGKMEISGITITTKIDRIDINYDQKMTIIDYKTGSVASEKDVQKGLEPQLALEALILCFGEISGVEFSDPQIENLQYYALKGRDQNEIKNLKEPEKLLLEARSGIIKLIAIFQDPQMAYICAPNADLDHERYNDYRHLARIEEWQ